MVRYFKDKWNITYLDYIHNEEGYIYFKNYDSKIYKIAEKLGFNIDIGHNFTIRLNIDGSKDTSFNIGTGFNSTVRTIKYHPNNKILIGGVFTNYNSIPYKYFCQLDENGLYDSGFTIIYLKYDKVFDYYGEEFFIDSEKII